MHALRRLLPRGTLQTYVSPSHTHARSLHSAPRSNHFCLDLSERLATQPWDEAEAKFMDEHIIHESEAILNSMPGGAFQQSMTRSVTRQVQKIIVKSWRVEWKRALAEYEEEQGIPTAERIVS